MEYNNMKDKEQVNNLNNIQDNDQNKEDADKQRKGASTKRNVICVIALVVLAIVCRLKMMMIEESWIKSIMKSSIGYISTIIVFLGVVQFSLSGKKILKGLHNVIVTTAFIGTFIGLLLLVFSSYSTGEMVLALTTMLVAPVSLVTIIIASVHRVKNKNNMQ